MEDGGLCSVRSSTSGSFRSRPVSCGKRAFLTGSVPLLRIPDGGPELCGLLFCFGSPVLSGEGQPAALFPGNRELRTGQVRSSSEVVYPVYFRYFAISFSSSSVMMPSISFVQSPMSASFRWTSATSGQEYAAVRIFRVAKSSVPVLT